MLEQDTVAGRALWQKKIDGLKRFVCRQQPHASVQPKQGQGEARQGNLISERQMESYSLGEGEPLWHGAWFGRVFDAPNPGGFNAIRTWRGAKQACHEEDRPKAETTSIEAKHGTFSGRRASDQGVCGVRPEC